MAALSLGAIPSADPAPLVKAAKDPSSFVREAVAIALGKLGGTQARSALEELAKDEVPQVRDAATAALGTRPKR